MSLPRIETTQLADDLWIVALDGEHDLSTKRALETTFRQIERTSGTTIIVDLASAEFIDSSVINALAALQARGEELVVVAPAGSVVRRVLDVVHLERIPIVESREEAVGWFGLVQDDGEPA